SRKVGNLRVPEKLMQRMRENSECLRIEMPDAGRLQLLLEDYGHFVREPALLCRQLEGLVPLRGREVVSAWQTQAMAGNVAEVFLDLMHRHYDPGYLKSMRGNFRGFDEAEVVALDDGEPETLRAAAERLMQG